MTDQTLTAPFGFRIDAAGRLELCPERQDAVATAYGLLIDGAPPEAIGAAVRALGFSVSDEDCVKGGEAFLDMRRARFAWGAGDVVLHGKS